MNGVGRSGGVHQLLRMVSGGKAPGAELPDFAIAAIELGRELYLSATSGCPRVVVLTLPTRDFFAVFMALGAAEAALSRSTISLTPPEPGELVIASSSTGTVYVAIFEGEADDAQSPTGKRTRLRLRGDQKVSMYSSAVTLLRHPAGPQAKVALSTQNSAHQAPEEVLTAQLLYGLGAMHELFMEVPASSIVGTKAWIEADLRDSSFAVTGVQETDVSLGGLLLTNQARLLPPLLEVHAHTSRDLGCIASPLVILDGVNVPINHRFQSKTMSQAILFDSTSPQATLDLAVSTLSNQFAFLHQDPAWPPINNGGLAMTERVSYLRDKR